MLLEKNTNNFSLEMQFFLNIEFIPKIKKGKFPIILQI